MQLSLNKIAELLKNNAEKCDALPEKNPAIVQVVYAFNGTGKTRLSKEFKTIVSLKDIAKKELQKAEEDLNNEEEQLKLYTLKK